MVRVSLTAFLLLVGCAAAAKPEPQPVVHASLAERMAQNPEWKPGDPDPVYIERVRFAPSTDPSARTSPLQWMTVVRNRCQQAIAFAVGPKAGPQREPPLHDVPARSAVTISAHEFDWVFVRLPNDESWHPVQAVSGHIIADGPGCDDIVLVERDD